MVQSVTSREILSRRKYTLCCLLAQCLLPDFYPGSFKEPAQKQGGSACLENSSVPLGLALMKKAFFPPWSGALSDNWQTVGQRLVVILVGASIWRAMSAWWVFAFVSEMLRAQLAQVPVNG